jgi:hypothetical protein
MCSWSCQRFDSPNLRERRETRCIHYPYQLRANPNTVGEPPIMCSLWYKEICCCTVQKWVFVAIVTIWIMSQWKTNKQTTILEPLAVSVFSHIIHFSYPQNEESRVNCWPSMAVAYSADGVQNYFTVLYGVLAYIHTWSVCERQRSVVVWW